MMSVIRWPIRRKQQTEEDREIERQRAEQALAEKFGGAAEEKAAEASKAKLGKFPRRA
jgi:hypothetical protein